MNRKGPATNGTNIVIKVPPPEFKTRKSEKTYYRVLETAIRMFSEQGFEKTTMRGISKEGRLGLGALYYYFPSKEAIVIAFYERLNQSVAEEFRERRVEEMELTEALRLLLEIKFTALSPYHDLARVLLKEAVDPESSISPLARESGGALNTSLELFGEIAGDAKAAKILWLGHLAVIAYWVHRPAQVDRVTQLYCELAPALGFALESEVLDSLLLDLVDPSA